MYSRSFVNGGPCNSKFVIVQDFHCHAGSPHESSLVAELACAAGYSSRVDPALLTTLRQTPKVTPVILPLLVIISVVDPDPYWIRIHTCKYRLK